MEKVQIKLFTITMKILSKLLSFYGWLVPKRIHKFEYGYSQFEQVKTTIARFIVAQFRTRTPSFYNNSVLEGTVVAR